jgi:Lar family restriction alleviation protein
MSKIKLLPCPFCGSDDVGFWNTEDRVYPFQIRCLIYFNGTNEEQTKEEAIESWNTRKPMERIAEQIEFLEHRTIDGVPYIDMNDAIDIVKEVGGIE